MARTYGSYMLQPTKDELRWNIMNLQTERDTALAESRQLKRELSAAEARVDEAARILGRQIIDESLTERARRQLSNA